MAPTSAVTRVPGHVWTTQCPCATGATARNVCVPGPTGRLRNSTHTSGYVTSTRPITVAATAYPWTTAIGSLTPM